MNFVVDGVSNTLRTISKEGEAAEITIDGKSAKWGISYAITEAKTKKGADAIMLDVTVTKNGEHVSHPKILTAQNMPATFEHKEDTEKNNYYFSLEPSIVN